MVKVRQRENDGKARREEVAGTRNGRVTSRMRRTDSVSKSGLPWI